MFGREVKVTLYEQFARVGKVTGHPKRLELLDLLCQSERSVEELAEATELKISTASAQLQVLRQARLVSIRRDGRHVYYRVADDSVCRLVQAVQEVARSHLSEVNEAVRAHFEANDPLEPIGTVELKARIGSDEVVVVDVRPREEFEAGHIAGAVSIPLDELSDRLDELSPDVEVVAYCRGPYCVLAPEAVTLLHDAGMQRVRRLDVGFPEWRLADLPVETDRSH